LRAVATALGSVLSGAFKSAADRIRVLCGDGSDRMLSFNSGVALCVAQLHRFEVEWRHPDATLSVLYWVL